jgi:hypothetical protein
MTNWEKIIEILKGHEFELSDSYSYHCGKKEEREILYQIADEILKSITF